MIVQLLNRIVSRPNVTPGQILHCTTNCNPVGLMSKENFPSNTQKPPPSKWPPTERSDLIYIWELYTTAIPNWSGTSVIRRSSVPPSAWVGQKTNCSRPDTVANLQHSWRWSFQSPANRKESFTFLSMHERQPLMLFFFSQAVSGPDEIRHCSGIVQ